MSRLPRPINLGPGGILLWLWELSLQVIIRLHRSAATLVGVG